MLEGSKSDMDPDTFQAWIYKLMELNDIFESWPMKQMLGLQCFNSQLILDRF